MDVIETLFNDLISDNIHDKVDDISNYPHKLSEETYSIPENSDLGVVWYLFGNNKGYMLLTYYSVLTFLRNTDLKHYKRYIVVPEDYEFTYLLPIFNQFGVEIRTTSKSFKFIDKDCDIITNHKNVYTIDSDCFAYNNGGGANYFMCVEEYLSLSERVGVISPYMCMSLNHGSGLILQRLIQLHYSTSDIPDDFLMKYYDSSEHSNPNFDSGRIEDIRKGLQPIMDKIDRDFDHDTFITNFITTKWPVHEVFCVSTEIYEDSLLGEIIDIVQLKQPGYWDDEMIYKIFYTIKYQYNHHIIPLTKVPDDYTSKVVRPYGVPKKEDMIKDTLYLLHPFHSSGTEWVDNLFHIFDSK